MLDPLRILVVEDHPAARKGLELTLRGAGHEIAGSCATAAAAVALARRRAIDVHLVDVSLPDESGVAVAEDLLTVRPRSGVVLYADSLDQTGRAALETGARGLVLKSRGTAELVEAIETVGRGGTWVDPALEQASGRSEPRLLSEREREIFRMLAGGLTGAETAEELGLSPETVRTHVRNAMRKLDARTRTHAVIQAVQRGLLSVTV